MLIIIIAIIIILWVVKPKWLNEANRVKLSTTLGVVLMISGVALSFSFFSTFRTNEEKQMVLMLTFAGIALFIFGVVVFVMALNGRKSDYSNQSVEQKNNNSVETASDTNMYEKLEKLSSLKEKGIITNEEFEKEKASILKNM